MGKRYLIIGAVNGRTWQEQYYVHNFEQLLEHIREFAARFGPPDLIYRLE